VLSASAAVLLAAGGVIMSVQPRPWPEVPALTARVARASFPHGVEGLMAQATHVTGIRRARYPGLPKTTLEDSIAAVAIDLIRLDAWWTGTPLDRTRTSHFQRLEYNLAA
jgi:hypothetical protein